MGAFAALPCVPSRTCGRRVADAGLGSHSFSAPEEKFLTRPVHYKSACSLRFPGERAQGEAMRLF